MSQDEDLAQAWLAIPEDQRPKPVVRWSEFDPMQAAIHDVLAALFALTLNVNSKGGHKPHYSEKPETAAQQLEEQQRVDNLHASLGGWLD